MENKGMGFWEQIPQDKEFKYVPITESKIMGFLDRTIAVLSKLKHGEFFYLFPRVPQLSRNTWYRLKGKNAAVERRKSEEYYRNRKHGNI